MIAAVILIIVGIGVTVWVFKSKVQNKDSNGPMTKN